MAGNGVQFAQIVTLGEQFGVEAAPDFPMKQRVAGSEDALLGRLIQDLSDYPEGMIIDIEKLNHQHITLSNIPAEPAPSV